MKPGDPTARSEDGELPALAWMRSAGAQDELLREIRAKVRRRRSRRLATASACVVMLALGALAFRAFPPSSPSITPRSGVAAATTTATVVRPSTQTLPDGSTVELKEGARIEIDFSPEFRRVTLSNGEAHFTVTKNKARPFIVRAGKVDVLAVGTAFSVQLGSEAVDVVVTEGTVQVGSEAAQASAPALVDAGNRCVVDSDLRSRVETLSSADADDRLAWRITQLEFSRTPLSEVVALMNQHAPPKQPARFEIADREIAGILLSGYLRTDAAESLVRLLDRNFNIRSERIGDRIVLHRAP